MTHAIDHRALRVAADQLIVVADAGYRDQLRREYHERLSDAGIRATTWTDPAAEWQLAEQAKLLALLTDAPMHQCRAALLEASGDMPRREIGLRLLADMAGEVRRVEAQAARQRYTSRRTA